MAKEWLAATLFCAVSLFGPPVRASEPEVVRFGVCLSLTGEYASFGIIYLAGIRIRLDEYNSRPDARPKLEMLLRDDGSSAETAVRQIRELAQAGAVAVIGSNSTDITLAIRPLARQLGIPVITPSATSPIIGTGGDCMFRILFDDEAQGYALAEFLYRKLGFRAGAVLTNTRYDYSRSLAQAFSGKWRELGGEVIAEETYDQDLMTVDEYDFLPALSRIARASPEFVMLPGYTEDIAAIVSQSLKAGLEKTVFCGGDPWQHDNTLLAGGTNLDNSYHTSYMDENSGTPEMKRFLERMNESHELAAEPSSVLGYDALGLLIAALDGGGNNREALLDSLYRIKDFPLATGPISIDRAQGTVKPVYITRIEWNGKDFVRRVIDMIQPLKEKK